jgi:hypothetical protein
MIKKNLLSWSKIAANYLHVSAVVALVFIFTSCKKNSPVLCNCKPDDIVANASLFSSGFNSPRGLKFGPDGYLYVAEGGTGGSNPATCTPVIPPVGPYLGSQTGSRISRVGHDGTRSTFVDGLPSSQSSELTGSPTSGVADVAFIGNTLYGLLSGAGCSHGVAGIPNGVFRVNSNRSWTEFANLSEFYMNNPVANPFVGDFEPDGTPYSMINVDGDLYAIEPNHGELDRITTKGKITRVVDISATQGHIVPTCEVFHDGNFYVGNLDTYPIIGLSAIYKITPGGQVSVVAKGFSTVVGVTFDELGGMYVLENTVGQPMPSPGAGDIIRIDPSGERLVIASGLNFPTAMTFGPDNKLYVSVFGFGAAPGAGEIWQYDVTCAKNHYSVQKQD